MGLISLVLMLALVGLVLYLIETYVPMSPPIKMLIRIVVVVVVILYLIQLFGISDVPLPRLR